MRNKTPALVQTTFKVTKVSGYWNKTMTLYGTKFGSTATNPLMTISYTYNGFGDPKGYGTSVVSTTWAISTPSVSAIASSAWSRTRR